MLRAADALGELSAHMRCPRPHLFLEEFPGFQLETVISVSPCLCYLNICNASHCSGFSDGQVHGATCHPPAEQLQDPSRSPRCPPYPMTHIPRRMLMVGIPMSPREPCCCPLWSNLQEGVCLQHAHSALETVLKWCLEPSVLPQLW